MHRNVKILPENDKCKNKNIEIHQGWNKFQVALRILVKVFGSQIVTLNFDLMTQKVNRDVNSQSENDNARLLKWVKAGGSFKQC